MADLDPHNTQASNVSVNGVADELSPITPDSAQNAIASHNATMTPTTATVSSPSSPDSTSTNNCLNNQNEATAAADSSDLGSTANVASVETVSRHLTALEQECRIAEQEAAATIDKLNRERAQLQAAIAALAAGRQRSQEEEQISQEAPPQVQQLQQQQGQAQVQAAPQQPVTGSANNHVPFVTTEQIIMGHYCRFSIVILGHVMQGKPDAATTAARLKEHIKALWVQWIRHQISRLQLLRSVETFVKESCPEAANVNVLAEFMAWYEHEFERQRAEHLQSPSSVSTQPPTPSDSP